MPFCVLHDSFYCVERDKISPALYSAIHEEASCFYSGFFRFQAMVLLPCGRLNLSYSLLPYKKVISFARHFCVLCDSFYCVDSASISSALYCHIKGLIHSLLSLVIKRYCCFSRRTVVFWNFKLYNPSC